MPADLTSGGDPTLRVVWDARSDQPVLYDPNIGQYERDGVAPALRGQHRIEGVHGTINCRSVFDQYSALCAQYPPERAAEIVWVPADQIRNAARLIGTSKAVSCYAWAGLEMQSNASQTARAITCLYALTGCFDAPGGNVIFDSVPVNGVDGFELMPEGMLNKSLGREERSLGPESVAGWINTDALYKAVLQREPYGVDALVSFGLNMLVSHTDGERGAKALDALEFMVHADLFMTPTATHADIFLPVNTPWEREGLKTNFVVDQKASARVQLRQQVIESRGESRSDAWIAFELAKRLGLTEHFWNGDIEDGYRDILEPSGISVEALREQPSGIDYELKTQYHKYRGVGEISPPGFKTPSRRVELYSETYLQHGYPPLPEFVEPAMGPVSRPDVAQEFPLILTDSKSPHYVHSQFRHVPKLRRSERDPHIDVHPETAAARGVVDGDWVDLVTPHGQARMRARCVDAIDPRVVLARVGWWQACEELSLEGYDAEADEGANLNRVIGNEDYDPIGGCVPHRSYLCEIRKIV